MTNITSYNYVSPVPMSWSRYYAIIKRSCLWLAITLRELEASILVRMADPRRVAAIKINCLLITSDSQYKDEQI